MQYTVTYCAQADSTSSSLQAYVKLLTKIFLHLTLYSELARRDSGISPDPDHHPKLKEVTTRTA